MCAIVSVTAAHCGYSLRHTMLLIDSHSHSSLSSHLLLPNLVLTQHYRPAAPPSALPNVELMMSTLPCTPQYSSVPLQHINSQSALYHAALHCAVLHNTPLFLYNTSTASLHCTMLRCTVLCCTILLCASTTHQQPVCTVPCCAALHCAVLHNTPLCLYNTSTASLHCTMLRCTVLCCTPQYSSVPLQHINSQSALYHAVLRCTVLCCTILLCASTTHQQPVCTVPVSYTHLTLPTKRIV